MTMDTGGSPFYYHYDGLGSVVNVTNSTGIAQWTYDYLPFGGVRTETKNQTQAPANVLRFTGQVLDPTGLYQLRARFYDPGPGRFLSTDPAAAGPRDPYLSAYPYVNGNPVRMVDPAGLESTSPGQWGQTAGGCLSAQGQVGIMGGLGVCIISGHLQLHLQIGASSGVGGSLGYTTLVADATSASQLSGFGAGFGASGGGGVIVGGDRCFTSSGGQTINCLTQTTGIGLKVSPEIATPAEIHAYGSFTIDFNDLVAGLIDALP